MLENENMVGNAVTPTETIDNANANQTTPILQENNVDDSKTKGKTFTEEQVIKIMRKRVNQAHRSFYDRYGVNSVEELDSVVDKSKLYDEQLNANKELNNQVVSLKQQIAFITNNVDVAKYDDINAYFKGKGIEFNEDNFAKELSSHPEWVKQEEVNKPTITIKTIGAEKHDLKVETPLEKRHRIFGI